MTPLRDARRATATNDRQMAQIALAARGKKVGDVEDFGYWVLDADECCDG